MSDEWDAAERLALDLGLTDRWVPGLPDIQSVESIRKLEQAAIQAERERCAKIAENAWELPHSIVLSDECDFIADAIRRGEGV